MADKTSSDSYGQMATDPFAGVVIGEQDDPRDFSPVRDFDFSSESPARIINYMVEQTRALMQEPEDSWHDQLSWYCLQASYGPDDTAEVAQLIDAALHHYGELVQWKEFYGVTPDDGYSDRLAIMEYVQSKHETLDNATVVIKEFQNNYKTVFADAMLRFNEPENENQFFIDQYSYAPYHDDAHLALKENKETIDDFEDRISIQMEYNGTPELEQSYKDAVSLKNEMAPSTTPELWNEFERIVKSVEQNAKQRVKEKVIKKIDELYAKTQPVAGRAKDATSHTVNKLMQSGLSITKIEIATSKIELFDVQGRQQPMSRLALPEIIYATRLTVPAIYITAESKNGESFNIRICDAQQRASTDFPHADSGSRGEEIKSHVFVIIGNNPTNYKDLGSFLENLDHGQEQNKETTQTPKETTDNQTISR